MSGLDQVEEAWTAVRSGFVEAFELADAGHWEEIDKVPALQGGPALITKTLHIHFPDEVLPISSHTHLLHFLHALGDNHLSAAHSGSWHGRR